MRALAVLIFLLGTTLAFAQVDCGAISGVVTDSSGAAKPLFIQNQFGATLGGPIIKDRTFFFGSWQSSREVNAAPQTGTVPTPAMLTGVFSRTVRDPVTRANFPNNTIPQSRWDRSARNCWHSIRQPTCRERCSTSPTIPRSG